MVPTQAITANTSLQGVNYHKYSSLLVSEYQSGAAISLKNVLYVVDNETYTGSSSHIEISGYHSVYTILLGSLAYYSGNITIITYSNGSLVVYSGIPYLARIIVKTGNMEELAWAGLTTSQATIKTSAYINGSGTITLEYLNGTKFAKITFNVKASEKISENLTLDLYQITASLTTVTSYTSILNVQIPRKYTPLVQSTNVNGSNVSSASGYTVGHAYFNGSLLPSIEWKGLGLGNINLHMRDVAGELRGKVNVSFTTIEFYGVNGTVVGYVHSSYAYSTINISTSLMLVSKLIEVNYVSGEVLVVYVSNNYMHVKATPILIYHNKLPVIIIVSNATVETTADVNITHKVAINTSHGLLLRLAINSTAFYVVIVNNQAHNVTIAIPKVNVTQVTISGKTYKAQEVKVNVTTKYITFNVTALGNTFTVFKVINGKYIELNDSNYFELNGKIIVFDDPTTTYLIVYGYTPSPTTASTISSTQSLSAPSSSSAITSSSSTTSSPFNLPEMGIIAAIIVILIVVAVVLLIRRK